MGKFDDAVSHYEKALDILQQSANKNDEQVLQNEYFILGRIGNIYAK